jgi:uncharacterized membrane protein (UPF0127 family)
VAQAAAVLFCAVRLCGAAGLSNSLPKAMSMRMSLILFVSLWFAGPAATFDPGAPLPVEVVTVETAAGAKHVFNVEVVKEAKARDRGLMFRQSLPDDGGMLFDYDPPQKISFWMKNTYISLDIIYIDARGTILNIAPATTPLSLQPLPSTGVARGVLELKAGTTARLGIKAGDHVLHRIFESGAR